ncbi:TonB-dependent receptor [Hyphococcus formosus]|uniref:TonB-dependent receptor n=1 Tax=Hyphococcus formosus TaxID=3143534 RepID=UPI00398A79DE
MAISKKHLSLALLASTSVVVLASTGSHAHAEEAAASSYSDDVIVITAQRRETTVATTGASVTALSASDLKDRTINNVEDLAMLSPSMHVSAFQGETQIYIRGIGYSSIIGGSDSSTALHTDGVYLSRSAAGIPAFLDVERVEVLRGPQGTLYGRNATGGSVNIVSKGPGDEFEAEFSALYGNYNRYQVFAAAGGPVTDSIGIRVALQKEGRDGFTTLVRPVDDPLGLGSVQDDAEDKDDWMGRVTIVATPSDNFKFTVRGDYYEADDAASVWHYFGAGTSTNPIYQALVPEDVRPEPYSRTIGSDIEHFNKLRVWGVSGEAEWNIGEYSLKSLSSYRETRPLNRNDLDASPVFGVDQLRLEDHHQFSQELQLSSPEYDRFNFILGAFYFREENFIRNEYYLPFTEDLFLLPPDPVCCLLELNGETETTAFAFFGEGNIHITDRLDLVVGARYSEEKRDGANLVLFRDAPATIFDNVAEFDEATFDSFTPKAGLNYKLNDDVFLYFTASKGFKSGGFNPGSYQNEPFLPEQIWAYEGGAKIALFDRRAQANMSFFYYDYTDLQVQDVENNNVVIRNAAEARVMGFELESTWALHENFSLDANMTWLDAEFTGGALPDPKFPALGVQDLDGKSLPKAPSVKLALGAEYSVPVGNNGLFRLRGDYAWQDEVFFTAFNVDLVREGAYSWGKMRATYEHNGGQWSLSAFVDNISNEEVASNIIFNGDIIGSTQTGNLAPPRTYGVQFGIRY